ncbi:hypothetical protein [Orrella sp. 11846]|uniref:hypothetical protein n=1 Tax=Orrella sp. 11846 TaxID=3409913 RepID=UPI003B59A207
MQNDEVSQPEEMLQYDAWLAMKVERARAQIKAGQGIPASEVEARFAARRAATLARIKESEE